MEIAVVGIACRLPGCADVRAFWRRLLDGADCITRFSRADMLADGVPEWLLDDPRYVPAAGYVDDAECFDADFFHLSPADARELDPQQRLLLESAYHALGDAGYAPTNLPGAVSVFAGCGVNSHFWRTLDQADGDPGRQFLAYVANDKDFAATRIAYKLGLSGAAVNVQTACSTSLVAVHLACQNLLLGESDLALAGAATLRMPRRAGYLHVPDGIDSPDGVCRPFDRRAGGTVFSDGVAMLALRRLDEALADGDRVYAVIKGSAVNNDGADKLGFTAPSEAGQTAVVAEALHVAGCRPEDLTFIETHGTGTALGDAVELRALATVFAGSAVREGCALGAVKANIGHTDTVAGAAGLIRAALALYHGVLPPQANFTEPDSDAGLASDAFFVNRGPLDLSDRPHPALAGVSSFGIGGSNAHVVLQAPPRRDRPAQPARPQVFCVAAADPPALERRLDALRQDVAAAGRNLDDVAYTLRRVAGDGPARACQVTAPGEVPFADDSRLVHGSAPVTAPDLGLLLPGQGAQYPGMGRGLYDAFPVYRDTIDEAAAVLRPLLDSDPLHLLFDGDADTLAQTAVTQPLVFATDVAAARLLIAFGLKPSVLQGHSLGEYAAACLADVFDFAAGLRLVARRGALMQALPPGRMLMVAADVDALDRLPPGVDIAAINAPGSAVISGPAEAVAAAEAALTQAGLTTQPLATSHAYHSAMMAPMIDAFRDELARVELRPPRVPLVSNLTGEGMTPDVATDPETWCRQLRAPVRFADGVATVLRRGDLQLLESGPGRTLASLVRAQTGASGLRPALATFRHPQDRRDDQQVFLETLAAAWVAGASVDWAPLDAQAPAAVTTLPPYPFARERHWLEPRAPATPRPVARPAVDVPDVLVPSWRRAHGGSGDGRLDGRWLIEDTGDGTAPALAEALSRRGAQTQRLAPDKLPAAVRTDQLDGLVLTGSDGDLLQRLAALARAFDARGGATAAERPVTLAWLAQGLFDVTGNERLRPEAAIGLGALRCLPLELPWLACLVADADAPADAAELLAADLVSAAPPPMVAYRAGRRWVPTFDVLPGEPASDRPLAGAVLITGGRGGVGRIAVRALAGLAGTEPLDVYLLSRQPPLHEAEMAALGRGAVRVRHLSGDVGAPGVVRDAVQRIVATHGRLAGVVHAAGTLAPAGFAPMSGDTAPALALHAPAKRDGTAALATALDETDYDFCLLVSSLSTWLGGVGYAAYAAANAYLDGVAQIKARRGDPWLSVAFDAFAAAQTESAGPEVDAALDGDAGADAFARAIQAVRHGYAGTALVSATAFAPRWEAWCTAARGQARQTDVAAPATVDTDASPAAVANAAWLDALGLDDCEPAANFFALGGSSLLALQVLSRLRQSCGIEIALADFLATPTLAGLQARLPSAATAASPVPERAD